MAAAGLGTMRNVAEQCAQTVMRADGLQQALGERRRLPRSSQARTSFAEITARSVSGKSEIYNTKKMLCVTQASHQSQAGGISATPATQTAHRWVHVSNCHACHAECTSMLPSGHAEWTSMSPSSTPATQTATASTASSGDQARHQSHKCHASQAECRHSMLPSATPATQNARRCRQVPRLPRRMHIIVAKCHACDANSRRCHQVPRLPRKVKVDVTNCHACHAK